MVLEERLLGEAGHGGLLVLRGEGHRAPGGSLGARSPVQAPRHELQAGVRVGPPGLVADGHPRGEGRGLLVRGDDGRVVGVPGHPRGLVGHLGEVVPLLRREEPPGEGRLRHQPPRQAGEGDPLHVVGAVQHDDLPLLVHHHGPGVEGEEAPAEPRVVLEQDVHVAPGVSLEDTVGAREVVLEGLLQDRGARGVGQGLEDDGGAVDARRHVLEPQVVEPHLEGDAAPLLHDGEAGEVGGPLARHGVVDVRHVVRVVAPGAAVDGHRDAGLGLGGRDGRGGVGGEGGRGGGEGEGEGDPAHGGLQVGPTA